MKRLAFNCSLSAKYFLCQFVWREYFNERTLQNGVCVCMCVSKSKSPFHTQPHIFTRSDQRGSIATSLPTAARFHCRPVSRPSSSFSLLDFLISCHSFLFACSLHLWPFLFLWGFSLTTQLWFFLFFLSPVMSSLLREEMQRILFRPAKQRLVEFIEIEEPPHGRHFLCVSGIQFSYWETEHSFYGLNVWPFNIGSCALTINPYVKFSVIIIFNNLHDGFFFFADIVQYGILFCF